MTIKLILAVLVALIFNLPAFAQAVKTVQLPPFGQHPGDPAAGPQVQVVTVPEKKHHGVFEGIWNDTKVAARTLSFPVRHPKKTFQGVKKGAKGASKA